MQQLERGNHDNDDRIANIAKYNLHHHLLSHRPTKIVTQVGWKRVFSLHGTFTADKSVRRNTRAHAQHLSYLAIMCMYLPASQPSAQLGSLHYSYFHVCAELSAFFDLRGKSNVNC